MFTFKLPESGKEIAWSPLSRRTKTGVLAAHSDQARIAFLDDSLMAARIISIDGVGKKVGLAEYQDMGSEVELQLFEEHVHQQEALRSATLREKANMSPQSLKEQAQASIAQMEMATQQVGIAFKMMLQAIDSIEAARDPLGSRTS